MPVIQIIADRAVTYSLNNGLSRLEYNPGEIYEVPDFAARGMIQRGWARVVDKDELKSLLDQAEADKAPADLPAFIEPKETTETE